MQLWEEALVQESTSHTGDTHNQRSAFWMPFTPNRATLKDPMQLVGAEGAYYIGQDGRRKFDGVSGLWCCNAGHNRVEMREAIVDQLDQLDFAPSFLFGHPAAFSLAERLAQSAPGDLNHVFFTNSGSEATDTALKIALAYQIARGEPRRTMLVGRERAFHGVGFGGISVGGMVANRKTFPNLLLRTAHIRHTHQPELNRFVAGEPEHGADLADDLLRVIELHGGETVAAVIVEPMSGSTGILPPPKGYLQRLRQICDQYGILLIFDEVITAFGRLGHAFAAERFDVQPDMICFAKGVSSGVVPLGGVMIREGIYDAFMQGPEYLIELFHGYTYSGHPMAMAAAHAAQDMYEKGGLYSRAQQLEPFFAQQLMSLRDHPMVKDIRCIGLAGAIDLQPIDGAPTTRARSLFSNAYHQSDLVIRYTGDTLVFAPTLISTEDEIADMFDKIGRLLKAQE
ncbi:aminotransferase class III-fold pyridoxal phosphate-dependent enzyme [Brucella tritici]|uniref:Aminotransferase class III-fold pyridoxal phosphate-dependent enzyme n=1 Tax=Brucella tritici TaxID=94626 RepID=A0A833FNT6_9HYPH|nr:aminotransferase class III-fold pyridoxal phosphate-dependent enzyme [Brucella tritici]